jgi:hypothetical protein
MRPATAEEQGRTACLFPLQKEAFSVCRCLPQGVTSSITPKTYRIADAVYYEPRCSAVSAPWPSCLPYGWGAARWAQTEGAYRAASSPPPMLATRRILVTVWDRHSLKQAVTPAKTQLGIPPFVARTVLPASLIPTNSATRQVELRSGRSTRIVDSFGNTTWRIGDSRLNAYGDQFGNTTGIIGNSRVNTYRDSPGNTDGSVGGRLQDCHADAYGNAT